MVWKIKRPLNLRWDQGMQVLNNPVDPKLNFIGAKTKALLWSIKVKISCPVNTNKPNDFKR